MVVVRICAGDQLIISGIWLEVKPPAVFSMVTRWVTSMLLHVSGEGFLCTASALLCTLCASCKFSNTILSHRTQGVAT